MYIREVALIFCKGYMAGRKDGNAKQKAIDLALVYIKPRNHHVEIDVRLYLERAL